jgi:threonylcarbamoyladenosine tRNA methylthiotransferase MtaB
MKVFLDMVGCRLNQSELERFAQQFRSAGHMLTASADSADLVVINTCCVTSAADADSRQKIHSAAQKGHNQIIVTGCWSTMNPIEAAQMPGISKVIENSAKDTLVPIVLGLPKDELAHPSIQRLPIPGKRLRTRAFIKVQDGCDNHCTYCVTRLARGASNSRPTAEIVEDIRSAFNGGAQEVVLTGVHLGSWGYDLDPPQRLSDLVNQILDTTAIPRLRLSSLEPWDITPDFFDLFQNIRICRHLHLPLQSGSGAILRRMGRKITLEAYTQLLVTARQAVPDISITTDIITGFPGETEAEFSASAAYVKEMRFSGGHVFSFSSRPGTAAAVMPDQVPHLCARKRNAEMRQIFQTSSLAYREKLLDQDLMVLWEKASSLNEHQWFMIGLSDNYVHVNAISSALCLNTITPVHITRLTADGLHGEINPV